MTFQCLARCHPHLFPGDTNPAPSQVPPMSPQGDANPMSSPVPLTHLLLGATNLSFAGDADPPLTSVWVPSMSLLLGGTNPVPKSTWYQPCPFSEMASATSLLPARPQSQPSGTHIPSPGDPATCDSCSFSWVVPTTSLLFTPSPLLAGCHLFPSGDTNPVPTPSHVPPVSLLMDGSSHLPPLHPVHAPVCHP